MEEAAAGRAVVAGAEGEARLDLDPDVVRADSFPVMRAMDEKAPGPHRSEAGERVGHPVAASPSSRTSRPRAVSSSAAAAISARISSSSGSKPK